MSVESEAIYWAINDREIERRNKLIQLTSEYDQYGFQPHPLNIKDLERLDEALLKLKKGGLGYEE